MSSAMLVLSWLVLCHLLADFVLQPERVATEKFGRGPEAWRALLIHAGIVTAVAAPIILVYGLPGIGYVLVTAITHPLIDRTKIEVTLRAAQSPAAADARTAADAGSATTDSATTDSATSADQRRSEDSDPELAPGWSPMPGVWFLLDQLAHLAVLILAWALLLAGAEPLGWWQDLLARVTAQWDGESVGRAVLVCLVITSLVIANVRAGSLFVGTLVRAPRSPVIDDGRALGGPSIARVGASIGDIERLLISALMLAGGVLAIGLVVAAKTLARFKQLDNRDFAEYYLLGTLASVTFAVVTSLVALWALA